MPANPRGFYNTFNNAYRQWCRENDIPEDEFSHDNQIKREIARAMLRKRVPTDIVESFEDAYPLD